jgi:hypothetical protein
MLPSLPLQSWSAPRGFGGVERAGSVLWIGETPGPLPALRELLGDRVVDAPFRVVGTMPAPPGRNPWAYTAATPVRWGDALALELPRPVDGLVLAGALAGLSDRAARDVLREAASALPEGRPWLLVEADGGSLWGALRSMRGRRGAGELPRAGHELRRLVEVAGLGIREAFRVSAGPRLRRAAAVLRGGDPDLPWLMLRGERLAGPPGPGR